MMQKFVPDLAQPPFSSLLFSPPLSSCLVSSLWFSPASYLCPRISLSHQRYQISVCVDGACRALRVKSLTVASRHWTKGITHASAVEEDLIIWKKIDFLERDFSFDKVLAGRGKCCESSLRASDMHWDNRRERSRNEKWTQREKRGESYIRDRDRERKILKVQERPEREGESTHPHVCTHSNQRLKQEKASLNKSENWFLSTSIRWDLKMMKVRIGLQFIMEN